MSSFIFLSNDFTPNIYSDPHFPFSITIPMGWFVDSSGQQGACIVLHRKNASHGFNANVNVLVQELGAMTQDEYVMLNRLQLKQMGNQAKIDFDQSAPVPNGGHLFEWHARMGAAHVKVRQRFVFADTLVYVVSATALYVQFAEYRADFQAALDSFRLNDRPGIPPTAL